MTMQKGAEASIAVYASPYDTTDNYSIKWVSSDENIATVSGNNISANRAQIHALNNGKAEIKAVLTVGEGDAARTVESPVCTVEIMGKEGIPELEPVYVLTNQATTLSQVKLPDGFSWKETEAGETASVKLEAGDEYQSYIAIYEDKENYIYGEKEVLLAVGTVSGIKTQSSILVDATASEGSLIGELSVEPVYKGMVDKESLTFLATVDSAYSNAMTVTAKEGEPSVFEIRATNPEAVCGKKVKTVFTMKLEGGDQTIKAQKGKLWFETASAISVAAKGKTVAERMDIVLDGKTVTELTLDASHIKDELVLGAVVKDSFGNDITAGTKLTWKSSNAKTASVDKNGKVAIKEEGNTLISVTAGDGSSTSAVLKLEIRDYRPRAGANTLTVNYAYANGTELTIHPAYGSTVKEITGLVVYDSKKKEYNDASSLFELQAGENVNSYILKAKEGAAVTRNKKATYNLIINTKITVAGAEDTPVQFSDADGISVKVTVVNTIPKVTVKQSSKINLFYKDTQAQAVINAAGADITDVKWKENGEVDFELTKFTSDGNKAAVIIGQKSTIPVKADGTADTGKLKKKGVLLISLEGYAEPAEVKFQVNTENKKPSLKLKKGTISLMPEWGIYSGSDTMLDSKTKAAFDLNGVVISAPEGYSVTTGANGSFTVSMNSALSKPASKISLNITGDNWRGSVNTNCKLKVEKPALTLSNTKLILSNKLSMSDSEAQVLTSTLNGTDQVALTALKLQPSDTKARNAMRDGTMIVRSSGDNVYVGLQTVSDGVRTLVTGKGNYKFKVVPVVSVTVGDDIKSKELNAVSFTVNVTDKAPGVTLSGKNKINILNRAEVSGTSYKVKISNTTAEVVDVTLSGTDSSRFEKPYLEDGKLVIRPKENAAFVLKRNYVIVPEYTMSDGSSVTGKLMKLTAQQPSVKAVSSAKSVDLFIGAAGKDNGKAVAVALSAKDSYFAGSDRIESIQIKSDNFAYEDGILYIKNTTGLVAGKTVKVTFTVKVKGQAQNAKPYTTTVSVKVKQ